MGTAWLLVGVVSAPWAVLLRCGPSGGLAYTFTSGAYQAWITDEVGASNVGRVFLRGARLSFVGSFVGLVALVALGAWSLRAAVIAGGGITIACGLACLVAMPETGFHRRPREERGTALAELRTTALGGARFARGQRLVLLLVGVALVTGMSSEAFDRLKEAHAIRDVGLPAIGSLSAVVWFGIFAAVSMVFGFVAVGVLLRRIERSGTAGIARTLLVLTVALVAANLVFALTSSTWVAIAALLSVYLGTR